MNKTINLLLVLVLFCSSGFALSINNVAFTVLDDKTVHVTWTTDDSANSLIRYDTDLDVMISSYPDRGDSLLVTDHALTLSNLVPDTTFYFHVSSTNAGGDSVINDNGGSLYTFTTFKTVTMTELTVADLNPTSAKITWTTNIETDGSVNYSATQNNLDKQSAESGTTTSHEVVLGELVKGETVYYQATSSYKSSEIKSFVVPFDTEPPFIDLDHIIEKSNEQSVHVTGTTEANSEARFFMRTQLKFSQPIGADGLINAIVPLISGKNEFRLEVTDAYGNKNETFFNVTTDYIPPSIVFNNFISNSPFREYVINITTSENATVVMTLNNRQVGVFTDFDRNFVEETSLSDGVNYLYIEATDAFGNKGNNSFEIRLQDSPFINITYPPTLDFTTSHAGQVIEGRTVPEANILVWVNTDNTFEGEHDYNFTANQNGYFRGEIRLTDISSYDFANEVTTSRNVNVESVGAGAGTASLTNYVKLQMVDPFDRESPTLNLQYRVLACGEGNNFVTPTLGDDSHNFKPYRLLDGTEVMNFKIPLSYRGPGELHRVTNINIKVQSLTDEQRDPETNPDMHCLLKGNVFPGRKIFDSSNDKGDYWYLSYQLNKYRDGDDEDLDQWEGNFLDLANSVCTFPLEIQIRYQITDPDNPDQLITNLRDTYCVQTQRFIDPEVDPRSVLPGFLRDASLDTLEFLSDALGTAEDITGTAVNIGRATCGGLWANLFVRKWYSRSWCTIAGEVPGVDVPAMCAENILKEKMAYENYKLACDRIFCPAQVPIKPDDEYIERIEVNARDEAKKKQNLILDGTLAPPDGECDQSLGYICLDSIDIHATTESNKAQANQKAREILWGNIKNLCRRGTEVHPDDLNECNDRGIQDVRTEQICCLRKNAYTPLVNQIPTRIEKLKWEELAKQTKAADIPNYAKELEDTNQKHAATKIVQPLKKGETSDFAPYDYGMIAGYITETLGAATKPDEFVGLTAYAAGRAAQDVVRGEIKKPHPTEMKMLVAYDDGLHYSSCFGQSNVWMSDNIFFEPYQNLQSSLQCACISDIHGRVTQYKNVVDGLYECLRQIDATGTVDAGACKQLFAQHVCEILSWLAVKTVLEKTDSKHYDAGSQSLVPEYSSTTSLAFQDSFSVLKDTISGPAGVGASFSTNAFAREICAGALFGEWDPGFLALIQADRAAPPRQSHAILAPKRRELIGSDPVTGMPLMEYKMGLFFSAGSDIKDLRIFLICDGDGDCPSQIKREVFRGLSEDLNGGRINDIEQGEFVQLGDYMQTHNRMYRYNKALVVWNSLQGREFDGEALFELDTWGNFRLFGCSETYSAAADGNNIFSCDVLMDDSFAEFIQDPRRMTFNVVEDQEDFRVPFSVRAVFGRLSDPYNDPMYLLVEKQTPQSGTEWLEVGSPYLLQDGVTTQAEVAPIQFVKADDFGSATTGSISGSQPQTANVDLEGCALRSENSNFPDNKQVRIDTRQWTEESPPWDAAYINRKIGNTGLRVTEIKNGEAIITYGSGKFGFTFKEKQLCELSLTKPTDTSGQVTHNYRYTLFRAETANDRDNVIYRAGVAQQKEVAVTFRNSGADRNYRGFLITNGSLTANEGSSIEVEYDNSITVRINEIENHITVNNAEHELESITVRANGQEIVKTEKTDIVIPHMVKFEIAQNALFRPTGGTYRVTVSFTYAGMSPMRTQRDISMTVKPQ